MISYTDNDDAFDCTGIGCDSCPLRPKRGHDWCFVHDINGLLQSLGILHE